MANPCTKTVTPENSYEVWANADESWIWFVLKKYKSEEATRKDPFARYFCAVKSPLTNGKFDTGDVYATTVKDGNHRIVNPLHLLTDADIVQLWKRLGDIPMSEGETLDTEFYLWPKGTPRLEVWQWFDEQYSGGLEVLQRLVLSTVQAPTLIVQALTDEVRALFTVTDLTPNARKHKNYQIELPAECEHTISKEQSIVGPIEFYDCHDGRIIVVDHAWKQINASMKKG